MQRKIAAIDRQLEHMSGPDSLRESRIATQSILKKRLANIHRREQTLAEVDSDLTRIEAQVDLILENATMQGKPETISTDIELASDLLGAGVFGDDESAVSALDSKYSAPKSPMREDVMMAADPAAVSAPAVSIPFPSWAQEAIQLYESNAASQFILYGNVYDQLLIPAGKSGRTWERLRTFCCKCCCRASMWS